MLVTRYLFKNLLKVTVFITVALTFVIWLTQSLKLIELAANTAAPPGMFFQLVLLTLPKFLEVILPLSLTISILFNYNRLIADNELIVMRACGINQYKLAIPAIYLAIGASIFLNILSIWAAPKAIDMTKSITISLRTKYSSFLLQEGVFNTFSDKFTVYLRSRDKDGDLHGLVIHDTRNKDKPPVTIIAKKGKIIMDNDVPNIIVYDGIRQQIDTNSQSLSKLFFSRYAIEIKGFETEGIKRWKKESERSLSELLNPDLTNELDVAHKNTFLTEAHRRIITPWNALSFSMIALVSILFGSFNRRGQNRKIILGSFAVIIVQVLSIVFVNLSKSNPIAISLIYINTLTPIALGFYLLNKSGEEQISSLLNFVRNIKNKNLEVEAK